MYTDSYIHAIKKSLMLVAANWHTEPICNVELVTVSENATFKAIYQDSKTLILRVNRAEYHTLQELKSEVEWVSALYSDKNAVYTPEIISNHLGENISQIMVAFAEEVKTLWVTAFEYCAGTEPAISDNLLPWFEKLGELTAGLHQHSRSWTEPVGFTRKQWNLQTMVGTDGYWGDWRKTEALSNTDIAIIHSALARASDRLKVYHSSDKYGLIHADLRLANLIIDNDKLVLIDFDDCGYCWHMYDFASSISFYELDPTIPDLQGAWVKGYRSVSPLSEQDEAEIPTFILLRRVLLTAWLATHSDTPTANELGEGFAKGTVELASNYLESYGLSQEVKHVA